MKRKAPSREQIYGPTGRKSFRSALCNLLDTMFPGQFGEDVTGLFADKLLALFKQFHPERKQIAVGQVVWSSVAVDDPPARGKTIENTRLVPVVLDLLTKADVDYVIRNGMTPAFRRRRIARLLKQAYRQKGVLSSPDIALMLGLSNPTVSRAIRTYEKENDTQLPRRGTIHDMGRSITHKAAICRKRLVDKMPTSRVASETNHDPEEVEYYVQCFQRVRLCLDNNMTTDEISLVTGHGKTTVQEYIDLHEEFYCLPSNNGGGHDRN